MISLQKSIRRFYDTYDLKGLDVLLVPYGSRVYGTNKPSADYDYIAIVDNDLTGTEYAHDDLNIQICSRQDFQAHLDQHKIKALECWYLSDSIVQEQFSFNLDLPTLRGAISEKSSHSFVKAKKKIDIEKDYYIGWKSLFHSLRILNFGIQIAKENRIDFSAANGYWFEILTANQYNWSYFKDKYQPVYNSLATEFRKLAPKD